MASDLQSILGYTTITNLVKEQTDGLPKVMPDSFYNLTQSVLGDTASYLRVPGTRTVARRVEYGAPALRNDQKGITSVAVKLIHSFEEITFNPNTLIALREYESYSPQNMGRDEVARQTLSQATRFQNLRSTAIHSMFGLGAIYFDINGNLLPSSSGAFCTIDYAIPAGNKNQLNMDGSGNIITASWGTTTTDIPLVIRKIKKAMARLTGYPIRYAFYGENVPTYISSNDYMLDYLARNPPRNESVLATGEIPDIWGITWIPAYESFFEDQNGTNQSIFGPDTVVFTPEPSREWYGIFEGSVAVPVNVNISAEGVAAAGNVAAVTGRGGYGRVIDNPVTVICRYFDTFLPLIKVPNAVLVADVVP